MPLFLSTLSMRRATIKDLEKEDEEVVFLSTLSMRRATSHKLIGSAGNGISIHALHAESDGRQPNTIRGH